MKPKTKNMYRVYIKNYPTKGQFSEYIYECPAINQKEALQIYLRANGVTVDIKDIDPMKGVLYNNVYLVAKKRGW